MIFIKRILFSSILSIVLLYSCKKKEDDKYYYLTDEQKAFINTVHAGDTVIWESNYGYLDTAVIQLIEYSQYVINPTYNNEAKKIGERASYKYKIVGTNKIQANAGLLMVDVFADDEYSPWLKSRCNTIKPKGLYSSKKIGATTYSNVYWSDDFSNNDTLFWSNLGYLSFKSTTGESVIKIK